MTLEEFQNEAMRTCPDSTSLEVLALGVAGEGGEVCELVKKHKGHGHPLDKEKLAKEIGDVLWYLATISRIGCGMSLDEVAKMNVLKLRARYPEGFSSERSINREENVGVEKVIVSGGE